MNFNDTKKQQIEDKIEQLSNEKYLEDIIQNFNNELSKYRDIREKINLLKIKKDEYIKQYISDTSFPNKLEIQYLNYKALLFYFLETFTYDNMTLNIDQYKNDQKSIQKRFSNQFEDLFINNKALKINVNIINFPHLIGYKDYYTENGIKIKLKSTKNEFLRNILYESNVTNDYLLDGCDISKIEAFPWISDTLHKPLYIFTNEALKQSRLKSDLIFVRKKGNDFHYVSLKKHLNSLENEYFINSHHHISFEGFKTKFNANKKIYMYDFTKKLDIKKGAIYQLL